MRLWNRNGSVGAFYFCLKLDEKPPFLKICAICRGVENLCRKLYMLHKISLWELCEETCAVYI